MSTANSSPLLDGTIVAHAHVTAHVQHRIDGIFVTNVALNRVGVGVLMGGQLNGFTLTFRLLRHRSIQTVYGFGGGGGGGAGQLNL